MPIETIIFNGQKYPKFQSEGFAARWVFPFAQELCKGTGFDIGAGRTSWALPGSIPIDTAFTEGHAMNLPIGINKVDYIFSSHCLEHLPDWVGALNYWKTCILSGGVLFLYLPHPDQGYWRPWNNRKHIHLLQPLIIEDYLRSSGGWTNIFVSERDLNHSFTAIAERV